MLTAVRLQNFKCFAEQVEIPFNKLTLLTGVNGGGKSSVIQALLLPRQSIEHSNLTSQFIFNGSCIELGSYDDVRSSFVGSSEPIFLRYSFGNSDYWHEYRLERNEQDDQSATISNWHIPLGGREKLPINEKTKWHNLIPSDYPIEAENLKFWNSLIKTVYYVSADRLGPQNIYYKQSFGEFPHVGRKGEYTANVLEKKGDDLIFPVLRLDENLVAHTVLEQTTAWLNYIFGGGRVKIESIRNMLLVELNASNDVARTYRPMNVGFGYSYALPIIVSALVAKEGEILIVENPEAHLHPAAQAKLTQLLAKVASCGVQVIVESHSEHILNAIRIAVLDKVITADQLSILYFDRDPNFDRDPDVTNFPKVIVKQVIVNDDATIDDWPNGFFDQSDVDLKRIVGF